ncbi:MAG TPA: hypothetical protein VFS43_31310 [Polyangiaceae bacterium]|nr:hypothetical protein [Polyangiaceae bacterium]
MRASAPLAATALLLSFAPGRASAQEPAAARADAAAPADAGPRPYSAAGLLGFGFSERPDSQGVGLGVRGGMTLPSGLYLGGTAVYHLGGRAEVVGRTASYPEYSNDPLRYSDVVLANAFYLGGEAGAEFEVGPLMIRPYAGLGFHGVLSTTRQLQPTGQITEKSSFDPGLYVAPGLTALYPLPESYFAGLDSRYVITPFDLSARGVALFATAGKTF